MYVSTPTLYQGWLLGAQVPNEEFNSVSIGRSRPDYYGEEEQNILQLGPKFLQLCVNRE